MSQAAARQAIARQVIVRDLRKTYRGVRRGRGPFAGLKGLFSPDYQTRDAVVGVSFSVLQGERVAIIGPNGYITVGFATSRDELPPCQRPLESGKISV